MLACAIVVPGRCQSSWAGRCLAGLLPRSSTVEVATSPPAVGLGPELALQLHQAPDPGVGTEVGLDVGRRLTDDRQVDAEQFRAPLQRRRDRPAQVRVVPSPLRNRVSNTGSRANRERCVARWWGRSQPVWVAFWSAVFGRQCHHRPWSGGHVRGGYFTVTVMQSLISTWVPSVLITRKTMSN
jgi:hypothetical protein